MKDKLDCNTINKIYKYLGVHPIIEDKNNAIVLLRKIFNEREHKAFYEYYFRLYKINQIHSNIGLRSFNRIYKEIQNIRYYRYDKKTGEPYLIIPKIRKKS
jgi:hypothetical protein